MKMPQSEEVERDGQAQGLLTEWLRRGLWSQTAWVRILAQPTTAV